MAREKIANLVAYLGIFLGVVAGITIVRAELYLSPMSYIESYAGLAFYFYAAFAIVSSPFLIVRYILAYKRSPYLPYIALMCMAVFACLFLYDGQIAGIILSTASWGLCPLLIGEIFFEDL